MIINFDFSFRYAYSYYHLVFDTSTMHTPTIDILFHFTYRDDDKLFKAKNGKKQQLY